MCRCPTPTNFPLTYEAEAVWASDPSEDNRAAFSAVGAELYAHPYWAGVENRNKALMKLKKAGRPGTEEPGAS